MCFIGCVYMRARVTLGVGLPYQTDRVTHYSISLASILNDTRKMERISNPHIRKQRQETKLCLGRERCK
jgi:hypothetical protein